MFPPSLSHNKSRFAKAFSLVELMTVIGLLALLAVLSSTAFRQGPAASMAAALRTVATGLELARSEAVTGNTAARFVLLDQGETWAWSVYLYQDREMDPRDPEAWKQAIRWQTLTNRIQISEVDGIAGFSAVEGPTMSLHGPTSSMVEANYIEFLPSGTLRAFGSPNSPYVGLVDSTQVDNWGVVLIDRLTGRPNVVSPE
jgi:Tfp pilus assembly protein FimT